MVRKDEHTTEKTSKHNLSLHSDAFTVCVGCIACVCVCVKATTTPCNVEITLVIKEEIKLHEAAIFHNNKQQKIVRTQKATIDGCMGNDTRNWASSTLYSIICREKKNPTERCCSHPSPESSNILSSIFFSLSISRSNSRAIVDSN